MMLAVAWPAPAVFAAIYHPIGTAMLVEAAGDKPGRAIGVNGVFGNLGVALAPVVTAFLADQAGWRAAFLAARRGCARSRAAVDARAARPCRARRRRPPVSRRSRAIWCAAR